MRRRERMLTCSHHFEQHTHNLKGVAAGVLERISQEENTRTYDKTVYLGPRQLGLLRQT